MPWKAQDIMSLKQEFVLLAQQDGANRRELCRRFGISPPTAYKWLRRYGEEGSKGLIEHSRRPASSPGICAGDVEMAVVSLRGKHPSWGGRKISRRLADLGVAKVASSTVTNILHRHGLITAEASAAATPWQRFEREVPNALWQADFKGHFQTFEGPCSPLTIIDDHSRFNLALHACGKTTTQVVQTQMERVFGQYGLPVQINFDNGAPWGAPGMPGRLTELGVWLVRLGIRVTHSRPYHPQTNGKDERFHRSLKAEVISKNCFEDLAHVQRALDEWRRVYNHERPHDALALATPITRYRPSAIQLPEQLRDIEYASQDEVRKVGCNGELKFKGQRYKLSNALQGYQVGIRPRDEQDGVYDVYFAHHHCLEIDTTQPKKV
ncbi:MAG: IS481 family transposase [Alcaligenaceae bacterium]|nr:MAG: IS481 family transposase [Alcaligenaceae bacterium]